MNMFLFLFVRHLTTTYRMTAWPLPSRGGSLGCNILLDIRQRQAEQMLQFSDITKPFTGDGLIVSL
jgi:hypothetical protein